MSVPFALANVRKVVFFKRDELTTDLICCDVEVNSADGTKTWFNHEEEVSWQEWLEVLGTLPGFDSDWHSKVYLPPFDPGVTVAYERPIA